MEKIKITKEQKEALEDYQKYGSGFASFVERDFVYTNIFKPLNDFAPEQFALLLCGWYEVEQPFKVGDWICSEEGNYYKVIKEMSPWENKLSLETVLSSRFKFEKVEEPWKITLLELGRDKPEFKEGDVVGAEGSIAKHYNHSGSLTLEWARENKIKYFYPVESRIEVKQ